MRFKFCEHFYLFKPIMENLSLKTNNKKKKNEKIMLQKRLKDEIV